MEKNRILRAVARGDRVTTRRNVLAFVACALAAPLASFAQQQRSNPARIGVLETTSGPSAITWRDTLIAGLRDHGYMQGKNLILEYRGAEGNYERVPAFASELVRLKVDVIVASASVAVQAAQRATTTIPIVMVRTADPVGAGFAASLARPGGNITGISNSNIDVVSKYLEFLATTIPKLARVSVLINPGNPTHGRYLKGLQATAKAKGMTISPVPLTTASEIDSAFGAMKRTDVEALIVLPDSFFIGEARRIAQLAIQQRMPTMFRTRENVESGGLMSSGQDLTEHYSRAASYIDKILKGTKPGDLPIEQPTKIELVINMKTAKAIGLTIPEQLLLQANKLIE